MVRRCPHTTYTEGPNPFSGTNCESNMGGYTVRVAGLTVNQLSSDSGGSTPSPPTQDDCQIVKIGFNRQKEEVISP